MDLALVAGVLLLLVVFGVGMAAVRQRSREEDADAPELIGDAQRMREGGRR